MPRKQSSRIIVRSTSEREADEQWLDIRNARGCIRLRELVNGRDDDVDDNTPDEACLLQAASVIHKYLDLEDGHLARESDALLDSFKYNLRVEESRFFVPNY